MSAISTWQEGFLSILPAIQTHAQIKFRRLRAEQREEAIQEAIAAACMNYQLAAAQGKLDVLHPGSVADFAVRHVRTGRHVGGSQNAAKDVMSPVCCQRHGVIVESYHAPQSSDGKSAGWRQIAVESRKVQIPDLAAFRIDFGGWLRTLSRRDRRIVAALISGERTFAVAERFAITEGRVSQLRRRFERDWSIFQGHAA